MGRSRKGRGGGDRREERGAKRLESYRAFVDDWEAFQEAIRTPEPTTLRANLLRISRDALAERLERQGFEVSEVPHQPAFLRVDREPGRPVSDTLEHWAGLFYMQQTATGLAAPLLGARSGERVLDLCSAPGGKTTHLAELMEGRGTVVAADVNESRIRALLGNIYRLGHTNILTVAGDGRRFPVEATFDRVMVDVPCSAEGTLRKRGGALPGQSRKWAKQVTRAQEKILRRAIRLTRPGGTLLYVTCTFGPQENEGVLTRVLEDAPVRVDPLDLPVSHARGLTELEGEAFHPALAGAARIYPHHLDSGGLFLCRLVRLQDDEADGAAATVGWTPVPAVFPEDAEGEGSHAASAGGREDAGVEGSTPGEADPAPDPYRGSEEVGLSLDRARSFLEGELGVLPEDLEPLAWMRRGTNLWAHSLQGWPAERWKPGGHWRVVAVGFRALDLGGDGPPRPTNDLLGWLGSRVRKNRLDLPATRWLDLLAGREVPAEGPDGIVALAYRGVALARGYRRDGVLRHEVPKGRRKWLRSVMEGEADRGDPGQRTV